eukprot:scaffold6748_cov122-Isochrysis_galbana.AAC.8
MELVVSRHGMPRTLRTDLGSNLASRLCNIILTKTGTDLSNTEGYRHRMKGLGWSLRTSEGGHTLTLAPICLGDRRGW